VSTQRPGPGSAGAQNPTRPLCSETTDYDEGTFVCYSCGCYWPAENYWLVDGQWLDEDAEQCPADVRPHLGDILHPNIADTVERCLLDAEHDPPHRSADDDWTDEDTDGYVTRLLGSGMAVAPF
jgi:hypothetical protein